MRLATFGLSHASTRNLGLALLACAGGLTSVARGGWTVISLHPAGATSSEAQGIYGAQQVGVVNPNLANSAGVIWQGSGMAMTVLNPMNGAPTTVGCVYGGQQGGSVTLNSGTTNSTSHASIWNSSAGSWVDLHPADPTVIGSFVYATDGTTQGGSFAGDCGGTFCVGRPCIWNGTADSFVDLTPANYSSGEVHGVLGNQQVGSTFDSFLGQACMWSGTADSFVDLNGAAAIFSAATCLDGAHQYGVIGVLDPVTGLFPCRWSGSADSYELYDLPADKWGEIHATGGGYQVGYITDNDGASNPRACVWTAGPGSYLDLQQFVPATYSGSNALGIWREPLSGTTYIVGYGVNASGQNEALMWVSGTGVNLITSAAAPADCSAGVGGVLPFSVRVLNAGDDATGAVTLTVNLPPTNVATFVDATPTPTTVTTSQLVFTLGAVAASGGFTDVSINLAAAGAGATAAISASAQTTGETDPVNNVSGASVRIEPTAPGAAAAIGLLSTDPTLANSLVPGTGGHFTAFGHPAASPSGQYWINRASSDLPSGTNFVLVRSQMNGAPTTIAQTGVTASANGVLTGIDSGAEVNDSGVVAIGANDNGASGTRRFIGTTSGGAITDVARQGQTIPAANEYLYGSSVGASANIFNNGQVGFATDSSPAGSSGYLTDSGNAGLAFIGTTPVGAPAPISGILINTSGVWALAFDAAGTHSIYQANINTGSDTDDQIIVADGTMVIQEGVTVLPGFTNPVGPGNIGPGNKYISMGPGGTWFVRGSNTDPSEDWLVRGSGTAIDQVYKIGDPIFAGASEHWVRNVQTVSTFFAAAADGAGNFVIGGKTDAADTFADNVLVYNGRTVIARENDPVDLDGNGVFDDGVYIRSIDNDGLAMVSGGVMAVVSLRDANGALCHTNDNNVGQAVILIPISTCGSADFNCDGDLGTDSDIEAFFACLAGSCPSAPCSSSADFNGDGDLGTDADIEAFFRVLAGGSC